MASLAKKARIEQTVDNDSSSFSEPASVIATHIAFELTPDFETTTISGSVEISWTRVDRFASQLVLDTKSLLIIAVKIDGKAAEYTLDDPDAHTGSTVAWKGQALRINIPPGNEGKVFIQYTTGRDSSALQWLPPAQTGGKVYPFLFTQCQAIHARSFFPCQDTPQVKTTYEAKVIVPSTLTAIMSALGNGDAPFESPNGTKMFKFKQPVACCSYLVALAVGDLGYKKVGPRTGVWAEVGIVAAAAFEFSEMEAMLEAGEKVCGPYEWGRYDVLCMPPSFPYGGMENPCLTFVTPSLLAGDRSLATVVIHEITHSWTGNLVTNKTWQHFWLNEGWTMYVQRRIMALMSGEVSAQLDAIGGLHALKDSVEHYTNRDIYSIEQYNNFTALIPNLDNIDPDDAFSSVPYEKGFNFLTYLEGVAGGLTAFQPFVHAYIKRFSFKTLTSYDFKEFYIEYFGKTRKDEVSAIDWDLWFTSGGMPPVSNSFDQTLSLECTTLVDLWAENGGEGCTEGDLAAFLPAQRLVFLNAVQEDARPFARDKSVLKKMDALYKLTASGNSEIKLRWHTICISAEIPEIIPHVVAFLTSVGRMKFIRPLYSRLFKSTMGKETAVKTFIAHRDIYHPIASKMLAKDLQLEV